VLVVLGARAVEAAVALAAATIQVAPAVAAPVDMVLVVVASIQAALAVVAAPAPASVVVAAAAAPGAAAQEDNAEVPQACSDGNAPASSATDFPLPEVRTSSRGVLKTTLHACIGNNSIVDQPTGETRVIHTTTYEGRIPGPTLVVKPGDRLSIDLINNLPPNPNKQRGGFFPHDPYTTNFHTHGLGVSPLGNSDNPFRLMEPGTTSPIQVDIPADQPTGTYWYHPHKHGAVTYQFFGGMAGFACTKHRPTRHEFWRKRGAA